MNDVVFRLISEQRSGSNPYTVSYNYDAAGNRLTRVWNNQQTNYQYDAADRLLSYIKPDGSQVIYGWDGNGNMTARTVVSGQSSLVTSFAYDYDNWCNNWGWSCYSYWNCWSTDPRWRFNNWRRYLC